MSWFYVWRVDYFFLLSFEDDGVDVMPISNLHAAASFSGRPRSVTFLEIAVISFCLWEVELQGLSSCVENLYVGARVVFFVFL